MDTNVSFNEEQGLTRYASSAPKKGGIIGLLIRTGVAKTESQANIAMIVIVVLALVVMGFIWLSPGAKPQTRPPAVPGTIPAGMP